MLHCLEKCRPGRAWLSKSLFVSVRCLPRPWLDPQRSLSRVRAPAPSTHDCAAAPLPRPHCCKHPAALHDKMTAVGARRSSLSFVRVRPNSYPKSHRPTPKPLACPNRQNNSSKRETPVLNVCTTKSSYHPKLRVLRIAHIEHWTATKATGSIPDRS